MTLRTSPGKQGDKENIKMNCEKSLPCSMNGVSILPTRQSLEIVLHHFMAGICLLAPRRTGMVLAVCHYETLDFFFLWG